MKIDELYREWVAAKEAEKEAVDTRRAIEDLIVAHWKLPECFEGTINKDEYGFKLKVASRHNRKVDASLLQEIAHEHGLDHYLTTLIRWKPEVNMGAWKSADESVTHVLSRAITTTAGRPSFQITTTE